MNRNMECLVQSTVNEKDRGLHGSWYGLDEDCPFDGSGVGSVYHSSTHVVAVTLDR